MKNCKKCKIKKKFSDFYKSKQTKDGHESSCIECKKNVYRKKVEKDPNFCKKRYYKHREKELSRKKDYYKENKEVIKAKKRAYENKKRKNDLNFKISCNLRRRINHWVSGTQKGGSAIKDLGCTVEEFKRYLESKFEKGMNWENYGVDGWHIDHIIPLSSFNLKNKLEFKEACHYTNMQPLWAKENLTKSNKIIIDFEWEFE